MILSLLIMYNNVFLWIGDDARAKLILSHYRLIDDNTCGMWLSVKIGQNKQ